MSQDWRSAGACRQHEPELFFPVGASGPALRQIEQAKAVCHPCPVREPCLAWALAMGDTEGVWGATSGEERSAMLRSAHVPAPTAAALG